MTRELETINLTIGDRFFESFYITDDDDFPFDLSIYEDIRMDIRYGISPNSKLLHSLGFLSGITYNGDDNNILIMEIPSEITKDFESGLFYIDFRFIENGQVYTLLKGKIQIRKNITNI